MQRKVFKPVSSSIVIKDFIGLNDVVPDGWFSSVSDALNSFKEDNHGVQEGQETAQEVKKRGRPKKVTE